MCVYVYVCVCIFPDLFSKLRNDILWILSF